MKKKFKRGYSYTQDVYGREVTAVCYDENKELGVVTDVKGLHSIYGPVTFIRIGDEVDLNDFAKEYL